MHPVPNETCLPQFLQLRSEGHHGVIGLARRLQRRRQRHLAPSADHVMIVPPVVNHGGTGLWNYNKAAHYSCLDVAASESRYMLTGTVTGIVAVYDLSKWGRDAQGRHAPLAQSLQQRRAVPHNNHLGLPPHGHASAVRYVQWYPHDTGVFVSIAARGEVFVWDANAFCPVLDLYPFGRDDDNIGVERSLAFDVGRICMHVSPFHGYWVAVGTNAKRPNGRDGNLHLMDLRSGGVTNSFVGHQNGVASVQWSPAHEHILVSGGDIADGNVLLWDVRQSRSRALLACMDRDNVTDDEKGTISPAYDPSLLHLRQALSQQKSEGLANSSLRTHTSHGRAAVTGLTFTPDGHFLISHAPSSSAGTSLCLWDLRNGGRVPRIFGGAGTSRHLGTAAPRLIVTHQDPEWLWLAHEHQLIAYDLHTGGQHPVQTLRGHLSDVRALCAVPGTGDLVSACLQVCRVWTPSSLLSAPTDDATNTTTKRKKRQRDVDTW